MKRERLINCCVIAALFIFLFMFFSKICPIVPYDGDDWCNLSYTRAAVPLWGRWNPAKIFPEVLLPFVGHFSAYAVYPLLGDYIGSIIYTSAFVHAGFVTAYFVFLAKVIRKIFHASVEDTYIASFLLIVLHFLAFRNGGVRSTHMFSSGNLTCYYHYAMPGLLNCLVVMYLYLKRQEVGALARESWLRKGFLCLAIYLAIFSNVFHSIILAAYASFKPLLSLPKLWKRKESIKEYICEHKLDLAILFIWLISLLFEANGGRARGIGKSIMQLPVGAALKFLKGNLGNINPYVLASTAAVFIAFIFTWYKNSEVRKEVLEKSALFLWCAVVTLIYLVLVSAKASPGYINRVEVVFGVMFYLFLLITLCFCIVLRKYPCVKIALPLAFLILTGQLVNRQAYKNSTVGRVNPQSCIMVDNFLIKQIQDADKKGKKEMTLIVPKGDNRDNWPHPKYMGGNISRTLKAHGMIQRDIKIKIQPDKNINKKFSL